MARTRGACSHAPFAGVGRKSEKALVHDEQRAHLLAAASRGIDHSGVDEAPRRVVRIAEVRHVSRPLDRAGEGGRHVEVVRFGERELLHACAVVRCRVRIFRERRAHTTMRFGRTAAASRQIMSDAPAPQTIVSSGMPWARARARTRARLSLSG